MTDTDKPSYEESKRAAMKLMWDYLREGGMEMQILMEHLERFHVDLEGRILIDQLFANIEAQ